MSPHEHQIRLRVRIILDHVQKDLGEYFYRDKVRFVTSLVGADVDPYRSEFFGWIREKERYS